MKDRKVARFYTCQVQIGHFRMWGKQVECDFGSTEVRHLCNGRERGRLIGPGASLCW